MTYNFDPDKWYENELVYLESRLKSGKISKEEFRRATEKLEKKYQDIWDRLDGSYQIRH
jgi:hypothetical protein